MDPRPPGPLFLVGGGGGGAPPPAPRPPAPPPPPPPPRRPAPRPPRRSAQLARLEHELGVELLVRHRRGVDLTDAGRHLVEHGRRLLADVDTAAEAVRRVGQGRSGRLVLAFAPATGWSVLPPLLRRFHAARPEVELRFL